MRLTTSLVAFALFLLPGTSEACSCFGPSTFCETLNPPYEPPMDPQWWIPDHVVLGVKLATVEYGVDLKIVQDFSGDLETDEVIRVWGDCGFLCRMYNTGVADGDTVVWGIQHCDLAGNGGCGPSLEEESHYQLSVCGVYWLDYENEVISGPLYNEGLMETIGVEDFAGLINGCLSTSVEEPGAPEATVRYFDGQLLLGTTAAWSDAKEVCITDVAGRVLFEARFRGMQSTMLLPRRINGLALVRVSDGRRTVSRKIFFD